MEKGDLSVQGLIDRAGGAVPLLRNWQSRPHGHRTVAPEFTNWHEEQRAWRDTVALMDQSHHMTNLFLRGIGALDLLSHLGINSFEGFVPGKAKQLVLCSPEGHYIGDGILFYLPDGTLNLTSSELMADWLYYNFEVGGFDATVERDDNSLVRREGPPTLYRYEVQGPRAGALLERVLGAPVPPIKFFHMAALKLAGHEVHALRHGMAGQPGYELFGPWADGTDVLDALVTAGAGLGLRRIGAIAYTTANLESGWIPPVLPGLFSGNSTLGFRNWLHPGPETLGSLGGSFLRDDIRDYYLTPFDLGYGSLVAFDHDFVGREALEKLAESSTRAKVTLVWNVEDVARVIATQFSPGERAKYITLPKSRYARHQMDDIRHNGRHVGISMDCGLVANGQAMISLATIDSAQSEPGTEVTVLWGEEPNSAKPQVEPHVQFEIRATVAPAPYSEFARSNYRHKAAAD